MVNHKNIKVVVNSPYELHFINEKLFIWNGVKDAGSVDVTNTKVVYCGRVDELFDYKYQKLGFRSLKIQFQTFNQSSYQPAPVINYPSDPNFTRITEYQKLTLQNNINKTTISHEYPGMWSEASTDFNTPYYPISNKENENIYHTYIKQIQSFNNFYLLGRLAQYKYFDMDDAIKNAFDLADKIISGK
jgi:UDP-galactopyranose mutase